MQQNEKKQCIKMKLENGHKPNEDLVELRAYDKYKFEKGGKYHNVPCKECGKTLDSNGGRIISDMHFWSVCATWDKGQCSACDHLFCNVCALSKIDSGGRGGRRRRNQTSLQ